MNKWTCFNQMGNQPQSSVIQYLNHSIFNINIHQAPVQSHKEERCEEECPSLFPQDCNRTNIEIKRMVSSCYLLIYVMFKSTSTVNTLYVTSVQRLDRHKKKKRMFITPRRGQVHLHIKFLPTRRDRSPVLVICIHIH